LRNWFGEVVDTVEGNGAPVGYQKLADPSGTGNFTSTEYPSMATIIDGVEDPNQSYRKDDERLIGTSDIQSSEQSQSTGPSRLQIVRLLKLFFSWVR
jgi:hypothetical protein